MGLQNRYRIMLWVIVILVASNLSMGLSFLYHRQQDVMPAEQTESNSSGIPAFQRARFFREQLNLAPRQVDVFRELNRKYNQQAWQIQHRLSSLRVEMVKELGKEKPDKEKLEVISSDIGKLHSGLKKETIDFYLAMKQVCTKEQQEKLNQLFMSVLDEDEDVRLPQRGRQYRMNMRNSDTGN